MSIFEAKFTGWNKIINRYKYISGISVFLIIVIFACKEDPNFLGRDLLPSSDNILVTVDFSTKISSFTTTGKKLNTSANAYYVLGNHKDSIFGFGSASVLTQFSPSQLSSPGAGFFIDSLVLSLTSAGFYGDSLSQQKLRVFELEEPLDYDTSYSDLNPYEYGTFSSELASVTYNVGDTLIRVKITNPVYLNKFRIIPDSVFQDISDFINAFDGLYLRVDPVAEKGGFMYLDMTDTYSKLDLYYNGDSVSYSMNMSYYSSKANVFSHDYTGFPIADKINAPAGTDSLIYIEGLAGVSGRISFPELSDWKDKGGLISINKAELILPIDTIYYPSLAKEDFPSNLFLYELIDDDYESLFDYKVDQAGTYFGGTYDNVQKAYVFNIGLHLQSYISDTSGKIKSPELEIISRQSNSSANRVILKGASSLNSPVKLKVIYTKLF